MSQSTADWLLLALTPGIGPAGFLKLIARFGSASHAVAASTAQTTPIIGQEAALALREQLAGPAVEAALTWASQPDCTLLSLQDDDYPQALAETASPPPLLFARGQRALLQRPMLAMVGSRSATPPGKQIAEEFSRRLSAVGYTIVSGLASGIDAASHRGALQEAGSTIAVIGTGIDRVYPASNRELAHHIGSAGLILSEFPLGAGPLASHFPRRNRIIAGLSRGCLVVEANINSGSLITARLSGEYGREVMAVPGSIHNPQARGCHRLLKEGARLIETVDDVLEEIGRPAVTTPPAPRNTADEQAAEHPVLSQMGFDPVSSETLALQLGLTQGELYAMLLELELAGKLASLPGGQVQRLV
ncbi:rossmann fold nucleotide-binding protein Smf [Aquitalea magnusonii]|uniref:Rossmann fold nucleotide-binding protein Smf n=1 Tax=Aquitalea magnusonii TaxID=332411 RepID=A0A3G9GJ17_9NEIS|nr:DNA-processing protein DprA [Aquitalea magnusonii]BBF87880.1 rossmann fold nucleotide-binding protein Smf [Aquitalea magnusonii]